MKLKENILVGKSELEKKRVYGKLRNKNVLKEVYFKWDNKWYFVLFWWFNFKRKESYIWIYGRIGLIFCWFYCYWLIIKFIKL